MSVAPTENFQMLYKPPGAIFFEPNSSEQGRIPEVKVRCVLWRTGLSDSTGSFEDRRKRGGYYGNQDEKPRWYKVQGQKRSKMGTSYWNEVYLTKCQILEAVSCLFDKASISLWKRGNYQSNLLLGVWYLLKCCVMRERLIYSIIFLSVKHLCHNIMD